MQKIYDVAVVGGGPTGGHVALKIAKKDYSIALFEKHKMIGEPLSCAGLITSRVLDLINLTNKDFIQNNIKGAHIYSPSGYKLTIGGDRDHAIVINRKKFDKAIINKSIENKADIFLDNRVLSAQRYNKYIKLKTTKNDDVKCKLLIGADGPYSKIRDIFNLPRPTEFLRGIGAEISNSNFNPHFVEIFIGNRIAPGFFAWMIPTNNKGTEARIGLCINENALNSPQYYFSNLFKNKLTSIHLENIEITKKIGGVIPLGPLKKTYESNLLLLGDAAAQVKPTSGGGIYPGLICSNHCSSIAIKALKKNDFSSNFLKKYQKLWLNDIGKELVLGMKFRKIFKSLNDDKIDKYIKKFQNKKINETISKYGDIDYPSKLAMHLLKKSPSLIKLIPNMFK